MSRVKRGVTSHARHKKVLARASGYRGVYVNRYRLPYEDPIQYKPDMVVDDFDGLADNLLDA